MEKSGIREWIRQPYVSLISAANANELGAQWQFKENVVLEHDSARTIVLDIPQDSRIGGIEFVNQIRQ